MVEKEILYHSGEQKEFLQNRKSKYAKSFEKFNSLAVGFSQSIRYQIEFIAVLTLVFSANSAFGEPAVWYVLFRLGSSALIAMSLIASITHYRVYYHDMINIYPHIRFFGDRILRLWCKI